ncbi:replication factor C subunit 2-like [Panicum virgatum]|uniref:AAA+ ATPase domain-containing protein n=1 Tax=Panicum virgatum TaxID=38727 RepID=A0A8T0USU3_PANVG|nr:replication factor C subunit 2-like [Panicum virgatum]KAG2623289.1 hypothetical protein PVAP13_3KG051800 [Panicum virgatum]
MAPLAPMSQPWVEKYRPRQVKDVAHQEEVIRVLTNTLQTADLPHMLFYGPPGTGKTTTALAIAFQLYGPELYKSRVLELNASDDRGINVVRTKIKDFAAVAVGTTRKAGYPCPPYKIIILDEADSMTEDAQNALRRTMETYSKVTRFFFICNYISRIIEPLASRCAKFRFKPLSEEVMSSRIMHICNEEGLNLDSQALSTLSAISQGDLRRAITYLQSAARLFGSSISSSDLISVSGVIPEDVVKSLLAACRSGEFDVANKEVSNIIAEGYPVSQLMAQFLDVIVSADDIPDEQKARICKKLGETDKCLVDGADEYLQLLDVASETIRALFNMPQTLVF